MAFLNETGLTRYDGKLKNLMAAAYSTSATYDVGDYCIHGGSLYRCTAAIESAESWTAAHWTKVNLGDEIDSAKEDIAKLKLDVADAFSAADSHEVGDYVVKDGVLYRCTTAISTAEAWTAGHWTAAQVGDELGTLKGAINTVENDLAPIRATGISNATGATIKKGTYFYLNNILVQAKTDISSGATFTSGTNYENATSGSLNRLINPPDIMAATKVLNCALDGTIEHISDCPAGWYQVKAINKATSGDCIAMLTNYTATVVFAISNAPNDSYVRAITEWVYLANTTVSARVFATDADDSGIFFAPPIVV